MIKAIKKQRKVNCINCNIPIDYDEEDIGHLSIRLNDRKWIKHVITCPICDDIIMLPEVTSKCEYCQPYRDDNEFLIFDDICDDYASIRYKNEEFRLQVGSTFRRINYCPMCGRKLKSEPYYEEDTECDTCEYFEKCLQNNEVIDCTTVYDTRRHYIFGRSGCYKQNIPLETENCVGCENLAECMREAMIKAESIKTEKGDVTFECRKGFFKVTM